MFNKYAASIIILLILFFRSAGYDTLCWDQGLQGRASLLALGAPVEGGLGFAVATEDTERVAGMEVSRVEGIVFRPLCASVVK